mmetsp:Transcript_4852/g.5619  ORF Transcript_4852/g.5619 Transcript_4852/m.5619 type:complete len:554 (+) Transcript_4852:588-2249(+)
MDSNKDKLQVDRGDFQDSDDGRDADEIVMDVEEVVEPSGEDGDEQKGFSYRVEIKEMAMLAWPLAISFFCRIGMHSTDTAFIGHISDKENSTATYLAAYALAMSIMSILMVPPLAFNQVLNALVGQAMGSNGGGGEMAGIWLQQSMFWLTVSSLPFLVGFFYVEPILLLLGFSEDVSFLAGKYARHNVLWPIPNGLYQCMRFYFQAQGKPRPAMYNGILFLFVNAFLNYFFIFGIGKWEGMGFVGAAVSLTISRIGQTVVYFLYMFVYKKYHAATWPGVSLTHHTRKRTTEFLSQALPGMATFFFQECADQTTTILIGTLGEGAIAAKTVVETVMFQWAAVLEATTFMISAVHVGKHLGAGNAEAAKKSTSIILWFITAASVLAAVIFLPAGTAILQIVTNDSNVLRLSATLIPVALLFEYFSLIVGDITSGVLSGMGRPLVGTVLSFCYELPAQIGGVAIYIFVFDGTILGVFWLITAIMGIEVAMVLIILARSNWEKCAKAAQDRQEVAPSMDVELDVDLKHVIDEEFGKDAAAKMDDVDNEEKETEIAFK